MPVFLLRFFMERKQCSVDGCRFPTFDNWKCVFHCGKEDWYAEKRGADGKVERDWEISGKDGRIAQFWTAIREEKMANKDYNFSGYVFPEFEEIPHGDTKQRSVTKKQKQISVSYTNKAMNFWGAGEAIAFSEKTNFRKATFSGLVDFMSAVFWKGAAFGSANFSEEAYFVHTTFSEKTEFDSASFFETIYFIGTEFLGKATFVHTRFLGETHFGAAQFAENADFSHAKCLGWMDFTSVEFSGGADFSSARFSQEYQTMFEDIEFNLFNRNSDSFDSFRNVLFSSLVTFRRCDLSRVSFIDSNVEKVSLDECQFGYLLPVWKRNGQKEVVFKETVLRKVLWDAYKALNNPDSGSDEFEGVETRYRQFKKNFEEKRDWESAGDFYHGEMLMRLKKYGAERSKKSFGIPWWNPLVESPADMVSPFS
jgi:uncharacterized protein YjbI with pentapeptide repeats